MTQTGHSDLAVMDGESPRCFSIDTEEVNAHFYVTSSFHLYVQHSGARKRLFKEAFVMDEVKIPPFFVIVGHGYVEHAGRDWRGEHCIRYCS